MSKYKVGDILLEKLDNAEKYGSNRSRRVRKVLGVYSVQDKNFCKVVGNGEPFSLECSYLDLCYCVVKEDSLEYAIFF